MARARRVKKPDSLSLVLSALEASDRDLVRATLAELHPADIARVLEASAPGQREIVWAAVNTEKKGEALLELPESIRTDLLSMLDDQTVVAAVRGLDTDDIADLIPELSDELIAEILNALDKQDRQRLD